MYVHDDATMLHTLVELLNHLAYWLHAYNESSLSESSRVFNMSRENGGPRSVVVVAAAATLVEKGTHSLV